MSCIVTTKMVRIDMKNNNRFTLRLSDEQIAILKEAALTQKRTAAAIIRNLIDEIKKRETDTSKTKRTSGL